MQLRPQSALAIGVAVLAAWALIETRGWSIQTALYPRVVATPLLVLALVETLLSLRGEGPAEAAQTMDFSLSTSVTPGLAQRRTVTAFVWLAGFFVIAVLLGFSRAIPLFVFAYLKGQGKETWTVSIVLAALAWLVFYLLFVSLLHLPFAEGLLWTLRK